jgi:hypothetical protein
MVPQRGRWCSTGLYIERYMVLRCDLANRYNLLLRPQTESMRSRSPPHPPTGGRDHSLAGAGLGCFLRATRNSMSDVSYTLLIIASGVAVAFLTFAVLGVE